MNGWLERLGYAVELASATVRSAASTAGDAADDLLDEAEPALDPGDDGAPLAGAAGLAASAAGGWLVTRFLGARDASMARAVLAGVIGTMLYDAMMLADQRLLGRKFDTIRPLGAAVTDDEDLQLWVGWAAHYAAGVGLAMLYARHLYGRLPGPPVVQGATFGVIDVAALGWGGVYPLLAHLAPGFRVPPGYAGLAHNPGITAQGVLRHLAYGVGVGLVYRAEGDEEAMAGWRRALE